MKTSWPWMLMMRPFFLPPGVFGAWAASIACCLAASDSCWISVSKPDMASARSASMSLSRSLRRTFVVSSVKSSLGRSCLGLSPRGGFLPRGGGAACGFALPAGVDGGGAGAAVVSLVGTGGGDAVGSGLVFGSLIMEIRVAPDSGAVGHSIGSVETDLQVCPHKVELFQGLDPHVPKLHLLAVRLQAHVAGQRLRLELLVGRLVEDQRVRPVEVDADLRTDAFDLDRVPLRRRLVSCLGRGDVAI